MQRPHCMHAMRKMRPFATDVTHSVVCVSVSVLDTLMYGAKTAEPIEMPFWGLTLVGPRNHVLQRGSRSSMGRDSFRLSGLLKSIGSFRCGVRSEKSHSIPNNGTTCDAAFHQNSQTSCFLSDATIPIIMNLISALYHTCPVQ